MENLRLLPELNKNYGRFDIIQLIFHAADEIERIKNEGESSRVNVVKSCLPVEDFS